MNGRLRRSSPIPDTPDVGFSRRRLSLGRGDGTAPAAPKETLAVPLANLSGSINLSAQGGVYPFFFKTARLSGEPSIWVKALALSRSAALVAAPAVQVECSGSSNSGGRLPTNS